MPDDLTGIPGARIIRGVAGIGSRAVATTLKPVAGAAAVAVDVGVSIERRAVDVSVGIERRAVDVGVGIERRAVDMVLDSAELERLLGAALNSPRIQSGVRTALASDGAKQLVASLFDSGLFDELADRLLASPTLWRLIDEIAASPAVTAAITQQGLGFADQVGEEVRTRSRGADDWLERAARRLVRRRAEPSGLLGEEPEPDVP